MTLWIVPKKGASVMLWAGSTLLTFLYPMPMYPTHFIIVLSNTKLEAMSTYFLC